MKSAKIGDRVRVKGFRQHATVAHLYTDIKGGVKLDRMIGGFYSWNVADLVRAKIALTKEERKAIMKTILLATIFAASLALAQTA